MIAKEYYKAYVADDNLSELSHQLISVIERYKPVHVLDFGAGSGKHSNILHKKGIATLAIDVSMMNVIRANSKYDLPFVACGDETYLRNLCNIDVVFTCSVLDHIESVEGIISEFKRIANKAVVLAETQDIVGDLYYNHDYHKLGFRKLPELIEVTCKDNNGEQTFLNGNEYEWESSGDGARYSIWVWQKGRSEIIKNGDDLA